MFVSDGASGFGRPGQVGMHPLSRRIVCGPHGRQSDPHSVRCVVINTFGEQRFTRRGSDLMPGRELDIVSRDTVTTGRPCFAPEAIDLPPNRPAAAGAATQRTPALDDLIEGPRILGAIHPA